MGLPSGGRREKAEAVGYRAPLRAPWPPEATPSSQHDPPPAQG